MPNRCFFFFFKEKFLRISNRHRHFEWAIRRKGIVRTSFGLDSKIGLDSGPTSPNNEFVERGRKN